MKKLSEICKIFDILPNILLTHNIIYEASFFLNLVEHCVYSYYKKSPPNGTFFLSEDGIIQFSKKKKLEHDYFFEE